MLNYIIGFLITLLCGREIFNYYKKKHLADTLNAALNDLSKEKVKNVKEKVELSKSTYDELLDAYNKSKSKSDQ